MFKKITLLAALFLFTMSFAQTISTITDGNFYDSIDRDSQGNIYCSDFFGNTVYKYDTSGNVSVFKNGFTNPNGISVNGQGEIFICDAGANTVFRYDTSGTELSSYSTNINNPTGIRNIPGTTDMLIVEYNNATLKRLALDGTVTTLFSGFPLNGPSGIAFIGNDIYVSNYNDRKIMRFENGNMTLLTQLPATAPNTNNLGFLSSSTDQLFATQLGEHQIYTIDPTSGDAAVYAGSSLGNTDGDISVATFNFPNGIFVDQTNDKIYVSDAGTRNLRIIDNALLSISENTENNSDLTLIVDEITDSIRVSINLKSNEKATIKMFEISGKEVFKKAYSISDLKFSKSISRTHLNSGTYIVLFSQENRIISEKVIL